jgi:putative acetyltransferase
MIRAYRPRDSSSILDVWAAASALAHLFLPVAVVAAERHDIADVHLATAETWVWETDGRAVGFIAMLGNEIGGLFVDPDHHGRGIGRALVDHVRPSHDRLEVEVFKDNRIGRAFYAAYGFAEDHEGVHAATGFAVLRLSLNGPDPSQPDNRGT